MSEVLSTRDSMERTIGYCDAILEGLAPDRGLYVPSYLPRLPESELERMSEVKYFQIADCVRSLFIGDIPITEQELLTHHAYTAEKFPGTTNGQIAPLVKVEDKLWVQNLSLGPTHAFKDMAMQSLAQDMNYVLEQRDEYLNVLAATSGDTGSAAEAAMKGLARIAICVLSPLNGMSPYQRAQMGQLSGGNVFNIAVRGTFDDCQQLVKDTKMQSEFKSLGAVNSFNWGRIVAQMPYYISGYCQLRQKDVNLQPREPVDFVVGTGNGGNVYSGDLTRDMGLPIGRLIVATNENNVLHRLIQTGVYERASARVTSSPSMDITTASNFERLFYKYLHQDPERTKAFMEEFEQTGRVAFADHGLASSTMRDNGFESGQSSHADRLDSIRWTYERTRGRVLIDPHTADAMTVARQMRDPYRHTIVLQTALPIKFSDTIVEALGHEPEQYGDRHLSDQDVSDRFTEIGNNQTELAAYLRRIFSKNS